MGSQPKVIIGYSKQVFEIPAANDYACIIMDGDKQGAEKLVSLLYRQAINQWCKMMIYGFTILYSNSCFRDCLLAYKHSKRKAISPHMR